MQTYELIEGHALTRNEDGSWLLTADPEGGNVFDVPKEGWVVTEEFMQDRDWEDEDEVRQACNDYLSEQYVGRRHGRLASGMGLPPLPGVASGAATVEELHRDG